MWRASEIEELQGWANPPNLHSAPVKKAVRNAWKRKFGEKCQMCGCRMYFDAGFRSHRHYATIDHIISRGLGGNDSLYNIQVICFLCNNEKSKMEYIMTPYSS